MPALCLGLLFIAEDRAVWSSGGLGVDIAVHESHQIGLDTMTQVESCFSYTAYMVISSFSHWVLSAQSELHSRESCDGSMHRILLSQVNVELSYKILALALQDKWKNLRLVK